MKVGNAMVKSDFKKGQVVYIKYIGYQKSRFDDLLKEVTVVDIGRKYITTTFGEPHCSIQFNIEDNFRERSGQFSPEWKLYLNKEALNIEIESHNLIDFIKKHFSEYGSDSQLSLNQLRQIKNIIEKGE
jgi:hypothetical protein